MEQPAARFGSIRMGLVLAASELWRKTDAVSAAPARRQGLRFRQLDFARWQNRADRLRRYHYDAEDVDRDRGTQNPDRVAHRDSAPRANHRMCTAECEELDGNEFSLLGRADQFWGQPHGSRISGNDRLLRPKSASYLKGGSRCFLTQHWSPAWPSCFISSPAFRWRRRALNSASRCQPSQAIPTSSGFFACR